eukprot:Nk52_evm63s217 gene=Nk52_evmTU63s217
MTVLTQATPFSTDTSDLMVSASAGKEPTDCGETQGQLTEEEFREAYEIQRCCEVILKNDYRVIALQFPDELLPMSGRVVEVLKAGIGSDRELCVLGDTAYGSCCVDEVAAEHLNAEVIIHYGSSCLSAPSRLSVIYVFGRLPLNVPKCADALSDLVIRTIPLENANFCVVVFYDVRYSYAVEELKRLTVSLPIGKVIFSALQRPDEVFSEEKGEVVEAEGADECRSLLTQCVKSGRKFSAPKGEDMHLYGFYLGSEGLVLNNLMMTYNTYQFYSFNPVTDELRKESLNVNRQLMKRFYMVEKMKDAEVVGIVCGTLGVQHYLTVLEGLKKMLKRAGKKTYTFVIGKLNVAKLANFMEIDVFVLISCPENTLVDSSEFYKPIVTPYEAYLACNKMGDAWSGKFVTEFSEIVEKVKESNSAQGEEADELPDVSLITGKMRGLTSYEGSECSDSAGGERSNGELALRNESRQVAVNGRRAAEFLSKREFVGLEQNLGQTEVVGAVEGRRGIAKGYVNES